MAIEKVTTLVPAKSKVNQECVEILENWLEAAKEGRVQTVVVAGDTPAGWNTSSSATLDRRVKAAMLLELSIEALGFHNPDKG